MLVNRSLSKHLIFYYVLNVMKKLLANLTHKMKVYFRFGRRKSKNTDLIIAENAELIKQIRMHRMKFYKHYKRAGL